MRLSKLNKLYTRKAKDSPQISKIVATKIMHSPFHLEEALQPLNDFPWSRILTKLRLAINYKVESRQGEETLVAP